MKTVYATLLKFSLLLLILNCGHVFSQNPAPMIRLTMTSAISSDETVFYFQEGGTTSFQSDFDAYKLLGPSTAPYIASLSDSILTSISGLPELPVNLNIPVKAITPETRGFVFSAEKTNFPDNVCVTLVDALTGTSTNILTGTYECVLYDSTTTARFTLKVFTTELNATSFIKQGDCLSPGLIAAEGVGTGPWNYKWSSGDSVIKFSGNKPGADSLLNLDAGSYTLKISQVGHCAAFYKTFSVDAAAISKADFSADVYVTSLANAGAVSFQNNSSNALFNAWDFGDKSGTFFIPSPSHNYKAAGIYTVSLVAESSSHCKDTAIQVIQVLDDVTGISELNTTGKLVLASIAKGEYTLRIHLNQASDLHITLMDLCGNGLKTQHLTQVLSSELPVSVNDFRNGMYLLKVADASQEKIFKLMR